MLSFTTDEFIWAINRDRAEEARRVRPHTEVRESATKDLPEAVKEGAYYLGFGRDRRGSLGA